MFWKTAFDLIFLILGEHQSKLQASFATVSKTKLVLLNWSKLGLLRPWMQAFYVLGAKMNPLYGVYESYFKKLYDVNRLQVTLRNCLEVTQIMPYIYFISFQQCKLLLITTNSFLLFCCNYLKWSFYEWKVIFIIFLK